ncbi:MAG TPA: glycosyltransferase [Flavisolibacter sp.]
MRFLSVVWYKVLPPRYGGQKGIALFNRALAARYPLACLCSADNDPASEEYPVLPELPVGKTQFANPLVWRKIIVQARSTQATHIILEHPYHAIAAVLAKKITGARLVVHSHNIEHIRFRDQGRRGWKQLCRLERYAHRRADLSLFKTAKDLVYATDAFGLDETKCMVLPYGFDQRLRPDTGTASIRERHNIGDDTRIILFAGTLDYLPNAEALIHMIHHVAPRLRTIMSQEYRIIICGRNERMAPLHEQFCAFPEIIIAGDVPDISPYLHAADVFINPVTKVAGVQTKIIDAIAAGCNVACFEKATEGIDRNACTGKLFAAQDGSWQSFAAQVKTAMQEKVPTPPSFYLTYSWDSIVDRFVGRAATL